MKVEAVMEQNGMITVPLPGWVSFVDNGGTPLLAPVKKEVKKAPSLAELTKVLEKSLDIKDRRHRFTMYKNCFVGKEAVTWMVNAGYSKDRKHAIGLMNRLHRLGVITHVVNNHVVKDDYLFYRLHSDKLPKSSTQKNGITTAKREIRVMQQQLAALEIRKATAAQSENYSEAATLKKQVLMLQERITAKGKEAGLSSKEIEALLTDAKGGRTSPTALEEQFSPTGFFLDEKKGDHGDGEIDQSGVYSLSGDNANKGREKCHSENGSPGGAGEDARSERGRALDRHVCAEKGSRQVVHRV